MAGIWRDSREGLRSLARSPGFTAVALLTLALGIGANTAIYSVIDSAVLHPLPYPHPDRIVALHRTNAQKGEFSGTFSLGLFTELQGRLPALEEIAAYHRWPFTITAPGQAEEVDGVASSAEMFHLLGLQPVLGRTFTASEDRRGAAPVAMISAAVWHGRFHGDSAIVGKIIVLGGQDYTIVGVFPDSLRFPNLAGPAQVWVPLATDPAIKSLGSSLVNAEKISYLDVLGRLRPGEPLRQVQAQADTVAAAMVRKDPEDRKGMGLRVALLEQETSSDYRTALVVLFGAVALVLLVACANIANLLVARATTREREVALRLALGAGRRDIARRMFVESMELAVLGGAAGAYLAFLAVRDLGKWIPTSLTQFRGIQVNGAVFAFAAVAAVAAGVLFGSLPAWQGSDLNVCAILKEGGRGSSGSGSGQRRLREALVVVEVALAVMLLAGAGLLIRSFSRLTATNPGFDAEGVAVASVGLSPPAYKSADQWRAFVDGTLARLCVEPGVSEASAAVTIPMTGIRISLTYTIGARPAPPAGQEPQADFRPVTPGYFSLMRIPLLAGRDWAASDSATSTPVCIINRALASVSFRGENPLGLNLIAGSEKPCRIVGIVGNERTVLGEPASPAIYVPFAQSPFWVASFLARGSHGAAALQPALRDSIRSMDPGLPIAASTMAENVANSITPERFRTVLVGIFAGLAIVLAAIGISGVLAYSVSRRTQEIGVRMALGAAPARLLRQVVTEGLRMVGLGAVVGIGAALGLTRFLRNLLYGVGPADPWTYAAVAALLLLVALAACALPAVRASRIDPIVALRHE